MLTGLGLDEPEPGSPSPEDPLDEPLAGFLSTGGLRLAAEPLAALEEDELAAADPPTLRREGVRRMLGLSAATSLPAVSRFSGAGDFSSAEAAAGDAVLVGSCVLRSGDLVLSGASESVSCVAVLESARRVIVRRVLVDRRATGLDGALVAALSSPFGDAASSVTSGL